MSAAIKYSVTVFDGAKAPEPRDRPSFTWGEFCDEIEALCTDEDSARGRKTDLIAFGPYRLAAGKSRADCHVEAITIGALDIDKGLDDDEALDGLLERIKKTGWASIVHTSPSDPGPGNGPRKVRVYFKLDREVEPERGSDLRRLLAHVVNAQVDGSTLDRSRLFFAGLVRGKPARGVWRFEGEPVDVDEMLEAAANLPALSSTKGKGAAAELRPLEELPPADAGIAAALGDWREHKGHKHDLCGALGGLMRKLGFSKERCERTIRAWLPVGHPEVDVAAAVNWARGAWKLPPDQVSGLERLAEVLRDKDHAQLVFDAAEAARFPARVARRAAAKAEAEAAAAEAKNRSSFTSPAEAPSGAVFVITPKGEEIWYYDPRVERYVSASFRSLHTSLSLSGAASCVETHEGPRRLSPQALIDNGPTEIVKNVHVDFTRPPGGELSEDGATLLLGVECPHVEASFDPDVDAWLRALAGESYDALATFIASCDRRYLDRPAVTLTLLGEASIGKSVLAAGLARRWGASHAVTLKSVVAQFNSTMARCPIVLDDESVALKSGLVSTSTFRTIVQEAARDIEPKGLEKRTLIGCQRFIITGNSPTDLRFADVAGPEAIDALAQRLLLIRVPDSRAPRVLEALSKLFTAPNSGRVDLDRLARHFTWLAETVEIGGDRFIGESLTSPESATALLVAQALDEHGALFDQIRGVLDGSIPSAPGGDLWLDAKGRVWCKLSDLAKRLRNSEGDVRWDAARVTRAIASFRGESDLVKVGPKVIRAAELSTDRLLVALQIEPSAYKAALRQAALPQKAARKMGKFSAPPRRPA